MKVFDSFAWVEYFAGTERGTKVKKIVDGSEVIYTPAICLTEIKAKYLREGRDPSERLGFIESRSLILAIDREVALKAGEVKINHKLHTTDALIYSCALIKKCEVVTGDPHFKGLSAAVIV
ncbi:MAG: type II toxin-antitoxin system VapC family toxin [Euryarchaeota archaeon]|nr:type II toxin-antitoxin system VapC family toxin [Euryarchaeota archaeon]